MIEIQPVARVDVALEVPGSKSLTQRALIAAALAVGESHLIGPLESEDTTYSTHALQQMGVVVERGEEWRILGNGGLIKPSEEAVFLGNNGTATRFLTSVAALGTSHYIIDGDSRMRQRPIGPLLTALQGWGADIISQRATGCPPLLIKGRGLDGGTTILPEGKSSQYLSSLLLVAPYAKKPAQLKVLGEILSKPYIAMTLAVMADFGIVVDCAKDFSSFSVSLLTVPRISVRLPYRRGFTRDEGIK